MKTSKLETTNTVISVTVKNKKTGVFTVYDFDSIQELKTKANTNTIDDEIIYFVNVNGTCVYSYLMFRCLANYTEGLSWGKLLTIM